MTSLSSAMIMSSSQKLEYQMLDTLGFGNVVANTLLHHLSSHYLATKWPLMLKTLIILYLFLVVMIANEPLWMRISIVIVNLLTITFSIAILITFRRIPRLQSTTGRLISLATMLETMFSVLIMLSQFYTQEKPVAPGSFYMTKANGLCVGLGFFDLVFFFLYFQIVNLYSLYLTELFRGKGFIKNLNEHIEETRLNNIIFGQFWISIILAVWALF